MGTQPITTTDKRQEVVKIEQRAQSVLTEAMGINITCHEEAQGAALFLTEVLVPLIAQGDETFDPIIAAAHRAHAVAIEQKKKAVGGLSVAKAHVRMALARWQQQVEDLGRQERLRLEQDARKQEEERIERELEAIEQSGDPDAAEQVAAVLESPRASLVLPPTPPPQKVEGITSRDVYSAEVVNLREFLRGIVDGKTATTLAKPDYPALNKLASAMREGFNIAGCRLIKTKSVSNAPRRGGAGQ